MDPEPPEDRSSIAGGGEDMASATAVSDPLSSPSVASFAAPTDLCPEWDSLMELAQRGQWRGVLDKVARARNLGLLPLPHHHLAYLAFAALALIKLGRFPDAARELDSLSPPFDSPNLQFQSHPETYPPSLRGSMLPFAIRFLHAAVPLRLGDRQEALDRLYSLLDFVRSKIQEHPTKVQDPSEIQEPSKSQGTSALANSLDWWRRREAFVMSVLVCNHFAHREFDVVLAFIRTLLSKNPADPVLLSRLGYVQLQIGDLNGAKNTFSRVESLGKGEHGDVDVEFENLVRRNRALGFLVAKDYVSAVREYEECIEKDPADVVAVNNKALCLMYSRDLVDSIKLLEGVLERVPTAAVNETLVVNLCSMYELAYVNHGEVKKSLSNWIARVAPDDFDSSCCRI